MACSALSGTFVWCTAWRRTFRRHPLRRKTASAPRNDERPHSRGMSLPGSCQPSPSKRQRVQGAPDAPVAPAASHAKRKRRRYTETSALPAQWFTAYTRSPLCTGLVSHRRPGITACRARQHRHRHTQDLIPASGRAIAYGKKTPATGCCEREASNAHDNRSRFDSALFSIRFLGVGRAQMYISSPSRGCDSRISICDSPAASGDRDNTTSLVRFACARQPQPKASITPRLNVRDDAHAPPAEPGWTRHPKNRRTIFLTGGLDLRRPTFR
jgi:hypothetical protein